MVVLEKGLNSVEIAEIFYNAIEEDDFETFKETVKKQYREQLDKKIRGTSPEFWWNSGRKYVEEYGVRWEFHEVAEESPDKAKLFFVRIQKDGTQRGLPLPVHLIVDVDGEWRVDVASV
jgi:hypothetical protein